MQTISIRVFAFCLLLSPLLSLAQTNAETLATLQHDWAVANYQLSGDEQEASFEALIEYANAALAKNPKSPEILIWNGIIKSSYAGISGGLHALSLVKQARKSLQAAIKLDDTVLQGSAYTSLGTLYSKVPGWPLGFGSDKKAVQLLQKALEINPDGLDSNYFYADYLLSKKDYTQAERYLLKAQQAAPRPGRPLADSGRQKEILVALAKVRKNLQQRGS